MTSPAENFDLPVQTHRAIDQGVAYRAGSREASSLARSVAENRARIQAMSPLRFHLRRWLWAASGALARMGNRLDGR